MNLSALNGQIKTPRFSGWQASRCVIKLESIMQQQPSPWQAVRAQAKRIGKAKTKASKRKHIVAWCELAKKALKGGA